MNRTISHLVLCVELFMQGEDFVEKRIVYRAKNKCAAQLFTCSLWNLDLALFWLNPFECALSINSFDQLRKIYGGSAHPITPSNSRHSPLLMPEVSCVTCSPLSIRRTQSIAFEESVAPPMR